jgi:predicted cupin superfamily sugar epimerase
MLTADQIKDFLKLRPLPVEGGLFAEAYRSEHKLRVDAMPSSYPGERALGTAIYYLLTPETFSALHRLRGDEVFHFYLGDPVEMLLLKADGAAEAIILGQDILLNMRVQHVVPAGTWQGSRLAPGGKYALMGTTMAPGFDPQDYEPGNREELSARYPRYAPLIAMLTR